MAYLTKSKFKLAEECPTKLFYTGKKQYADTKGDDTFLAALAEGGFQVGELTKYYYPGGHEIKERRHDLAWNETKKLLKQENVIIYEAAILYQNLFIRIDILKKQGNNIELIEVKAKSTDGSNYSDFLNKKGKIGSSWRPYIYDVAFQKYVTQKALPQYAIKGFLMLADKNARATVNGLNQKFQLRKNEKGRTYVEVKGDVSPDALGKQVLRKICVDEIIDPLISNDEIKFNDNRSFAEHIQYLAEHNNNDQKIITPIGKYCKSCEFKANSAQEKKGMLSGFKECWKHQLSWTDDLFDKPLIFDVWNLRAKKLLDQGIYHMEDLEKEHIGDIRPNKDGSISSKERQWLQIEKNNSSDENCYVDVDGLKKELDSYTYPLHHIDFETSMVAIPFYEGRKPYEQTAFQFSHHTIDADGKIEHKGQYLCTEKGKFPNFDFVRALKKELENDEGTIFRYAAHENTVLNQIMPQLQDSDVNEVVDKKELIEFIQTITHSANHTGVRDMVDMLDLVKKYYYHPAMGGSNSIKSVLPAILNSSDLIKEKYSKPIYGKNSEIRSLNFEDGWAWIEYDEEGKVISPYKLLPNLHDNIEIDEIDEFIFGDKLADGGAAMTAYAKMQFMHISDDEYKAIGKGLLKYCELDTMAMVFIWEHFNKLVNK